MKARTLIAAAALVALTACGGGGGGGGGFAVASAPTSAPAKEEVTEQPIKPPPICSVWLEGDSILNGSFFPASKLAEVPAAALARMRPMYRVVDKTVPGNSVQLRMGGFLAEQFDTRFVVIQFGINDGGNGFDYREPLRSLVQRVKALGKTPIVTGLSHVRGAPAWRDNYDALARQVAEEEGAIFADWGAAAFDPADMADDVHPAQAYSLRLVEQLVRALDKAAPECVVRAYTVTVQLRAPAETIERRWTSAEDAVDAVLLTLTHLPTPQRERVDRVLVVESTS